MSMISGSLGHPKIVGQDLTEGACEFLRCILKQGKIHREHDRTEAGEDDRDSCELYAGAFDEVAAIGMQISLRTDPRTLIRIEDAANSLRNVVHLLPKELGLSRVPPLEAKAEARVINLQALVGIAAL